MIENSIELCFLCYVSFCPGFHWLWESPWWKEERHWAKSFSHRSRWHQTVRTHFPSYSYSSWCLWTFFHKTFFFYRGIPNYDFKVGKLTFIRNSRPQPRKTEEVLQMTRLIYISYPHPRHLLTWNDVQEICKIEGWITCQPGWRLTVTDFVRVQDDSSSSFIAFSGEGQSLRKKGRKPWWNHPYTRNK